MDDYMEITDVEIMNDVDEQSNNIDDSTNMPLDQIGGDEDESRTEVKAGSMDTILQNRVQAIHDPFVARWSKATFQNENSRISKWEILNEQISKIIDIIIDVSGISTRHVPGWWRDKYKDDDDVQSKGNQELNAKTVFLLHSVNKYDEKKSDGNERGPPSENYKDYHSHLRTFYADLSTLKGLVFVTSFFPFSFPFGSGENYKIKNDISSLSRFMLYYLRLKLELIRTRLLVVVGGQHVRYIIKAFMQGRMEDKIFKETYSKEAVTVKLYNQKNHKAEIALLYCPSAYEVHGPEPDPEDKTAVGIYTYKLNTYNKFKEAIYAFQNPMTKFKKAIEQVNAKAKKELVDPSIPVFKDSETGKRKIDIVNYTVAAQQIEEKRKKVSKAKSVKANKPKLRKEKQEREAKEAILKENRKKMAITLSDGKSNAFAELAAGSVSLVKKTIATKYKKGIEKVSQTNKVVLEPAKLKATIKIPKNSTLTAVKPKKSILKKTATKIKKPREKKKKVVFTPFIVTSKEEGGEKVVVDAFSLLMKSSQRK